MKQFKSSQLLIVAMMSVFVDISSAMDCKEVFQRKEEIKECCTAPAVLKMDDFDECMSKAEGNHHEKFFCGSECMLKAQGLMNGDDVDMDGIKKNAEGLEGDWKETVLQIVDTCGQKIDAIKAEMEQRGGSKGQCSASAGILVMCLGNGYIQSCPAEHFHESELCNKVKSGECDKRPKGGHHH
ncbi:uncharacterized protein LOC135708568 [Ochlerotatus camptorhynchus]|uniref:uncharacterized protein LOC135708568 n=1 Tax=Ochlerotatus camptorhynchus TaxID=644619 RepID=UPI0031E44BD2